jgi:hypothetical protein
MSIPAIGLSFLALIISVSFVNRERSHFREKSFDLSYRKVRPGDYAETAEAGKTSPKSAGFGEPRGLNRSFGAVGIRG